MRSFPEGRELIVRGGFIYLPYPATSGKRFGLILMREWGRNAGRPRQVRRLRLVVRCFLSVLAD